MEGLDVKSFVGSYLNSCCLLDPNNINSKSYLDNNNNDNLLSVFSRAATCCILIVIGFDIDVVTNYIYPIYSIRWDNTFDNHFYSDETKERDATPKVDDEDYDVESIDFTNYTFPNDIWNQRADWEIAAKSIAVVPVTILAIIGNFAVIRIIIKARLFRNPINMFILNMSIADLLCALIFPWIILVTDLNQNFLLGNYICRAEGFCLVTLMLASVLSLTSISYDRLTAVVFPFKQRMDRRKAKIIIWTVWIISFAISVPLILWRSYHERTWADYHEKWCTEDTKKLKLYWPLVMILLVWVPLAILTFSYTAIVIKLDTLEKRQRDHPAQVKIKSKVIRMLFAIVIIYAIGWIPFSVFIIIRHDLNGRNNGEKVPSWFKHLYFISHYLMFVNSAVNPIIYGLKNDNLKKEIRLALPAFLRTKETVEISAVYNNNHFRQHKIQNNLNNGQKQQHTAGLHNNRMMKTKDNARWILNRKDTRHNLWRSETSSFDDNNGPASIVSMKRSSSALEDIGINVTSTLTKLTIPD